MGIHYWVFFPKLGKNVLFYIGVAKLTENIPKKTNDIPSILKQSTELLKISILQPIQYSSNLRNQDNDLSLDFLCQFCNTNVVEHI